MVTSLGVGSLPRLGKWPANWKSSVLPHFPRVDLRLCKLPASEIPPFSWGHENGSNVIIKNKGAIVLWVKMHKKRP